MFKFSSKLKSTATKKWTFFKASYLGKKVEWVYCVAKFTKELWRLKFKQNETKVSLFSSHLLLTRNTAQRKGKQSRHDVNISTSVKEELHPVEGSSITDCCKILHKIHHCNQYLFSKLEKMKYCVQAKKKKKY